MIWWLFCSTLFLLGVGCGVLLAQARERDRARQKLRDQYELERKTPVLSKAAPLKDYLMAMSPYRSADKPAALPASECTCDLTMTYDSCAFCERQRKQPVTAPKKPDPSTWLFKGDCNHCGSEHIYRLGDVPGGILPSVTCGACGRGEVHHYPSNRIKD